jgi:hypothetical protein
VTAVFWLTTQPLSKVLDPAVPPVCWPFFEHCAEWRLLDPAAVTGVVLTLLLLAVVNAILFIQRGRVLLAYSMLLGLTAFKATLVAQDYRLVLNQHYMALFTVFVYLFLPSKRRALQYLIVSFYFWAGLLKLNHDWISGLALNGRRPFGAPESLVSPMCIYVIALELFIVLGLLSKRRWVFWMALSQVLLFHLGSFWVVGFFYPILMFLIVLIFTLARFGPPAPTTDGVGARPPSLAALWHNIEAPTTYALLVGFGFLQMIPRLFPGDPSITGEGRMFALNMFDAPLQCRAQAVIHTSGAPDRLVELHTPFLQARISCDPIVYIEVAKDHCRANGTDRRFDDFDLSLETRRRSQGAFQTVVSIQAVCETNPTYSIWRHNEWIRPVY